MMAPLVTLQRTATAAVSPVLVRPTAVKSATWYWCSVRTWGETASRAAGSAGRVGNSHATTPVSARARAQRHVVRGYITPPHEEVRRLDWRGTRTACGSLVALRPRLSPGLP